MVARDRGVVQPNSQRLVSHQPTSYSVTRTGAGVIASANAPSRVPLWGLMAAHALSLIGTRAAAIALPWYVIQTTGSPSRAGLIAFAGTLPILLAALGGGWAAEKFGRRRTSVIADVLSGVCVAIIPILVATVGLAFGVLLGLAALGALFDLPGFSARQSLIPAVARVGAVRLEMANAWWKTLESGAIVFGPSLAGVLIAVFGAERALWLTAATFALSTTLVLVAVPAWLERPSGADDARFVTHGLARQLDGFRVLWNDPVLRGIAIRTTVIALVVVPLFAVVLPFYFEKSGFGPGAFGGFVGALGVGAVIGALGFGALADKIPRRAVLLTGLVGISFALAVLVPLPPLAFLVSAAFLGGIAFGPLQPLMQTITQERTPDFQQVRVFAALGALNLIAAPLSVLIAGFAVELGGVRWILLFTAAAALAVTVWTFFSPPMRNLDAPPEERRTA